MKTQKAAMTRTLWMVVVLLAALFLLALPVGAQTQPEQAAATAAAGESAIDAPVVLAVATDEAGPNVTVNVNLPPTDTSETPGSGIPANNETAPSSPIYYVIVVVMATLLVAVTIFGGYIINALKALVPAETAASIYQSGVRFGLQVALNQAAQTPGTLDDEFFTEMARLRGLTVVKRIDGTYEVTSPAAG